MKFSNSTALMLCVLLKKMISHLKFVLSHLHLSLFSIPHHTKTLHFQNQEGSVHQYFWGVLNQSIFQSNIMFVAKLKVKYRNVPHTSCFHIRIFSPLSTSPTRVAHVTTDEPTGTHHNHSRSFSLRYGSVLVLYVHGFGQMYDEHFMLIISCDYTNL